MDETAELIRRYFAVVADLGATVAELEALLHPDITLTEHPNAISPRGRVHDHDGVLAAYASGKTLLAAQSIDVHEVVVDGARAAVRATWRARTARAAGPLPEGSRLEAQLAAFITVADGRIREHETFDCYSPLPTAG